MRVAVTGATGVVGHALVAGLLQRGDEVVVLSRDADKARAALGEVEAHTWADPNSQEAPTDALRGCEGVVHLLGEPVAQRWTPEAKRAIRDSRVLGTRNLVAGLRAADARMSVLVSGSATGWYGARDDEPVDERTPAAEGDFLADVCVGWENAAREAEELGLRVVRARTGVVLSGSGGALSQMLTPFKLGVGGPVAGGRQWVPWIHLEDEVGALLHCLDNEQASGPVNLTAPEPVTNRELSKTLGRVLRRPAFMPVPGFAIRARYGEMGSIVTTGARVMPRKLHALSYEFRQPDLEQALRSATGRG
jgi:uncharacterized protein (TIGR01777 family)